MKSANTPLLLLLLLAAACAKQGYPNGGPRDTEPPRPVGTKPANESLNFAANGFQVQFDEYVVLKNATENVLISPPIDPQPEFTVRGKTLQVGWDAGVRLDSATTYLFQFKEAVADYTEGNLLPSFEYVFSTGSRLDTAMLAGVVTDAHSGKPWPEALTVGAYRAARFAADTADTLALHTRPDHVTRTDQQGRFAFHYIPAGAYRLVAFDDKNRDLKVGPAEAIAWDTAALAATDSVDSLAMPRLRISAPDRRVQRVLKAELTARGRAMVATALPMQAPALAGDSLVARLTPGADTLNAWFLNPKADSATLVLTDPTGLDDTLRLKLRAPSRGRNLGRGQRSTDDAEPLLRPLCAGQAACYDDLRLALTRPVSAVADSLWCTVTAVKDSSAFTAPIVADTAALQATIAATLRSGESYNISLPAGLFTDLYGQPSDSLGFTLTPRDHATLRLHIVNRMGAPLAVELLDERDTLLAVRPVGPDGDLVFTHLREGTYRLRAVVDADSNGLWTPGDYLLGRQPETVVDFDKTLQLREKWEMEERWTVQPGRHSAPARTFGNGAPQPSLPGRSAPPAPKR